MNNLRIAIDSDDAAIELKEVVYRHLKAKGYNIVDLNYSDIKKAYYPEIGFHLAGKIKSGEYDRGILICGTGLGMAMVANKVEGIYAGYVTMYSLLSVWQRAMLRKS